MGPSEPRRPGIETEQRQKRQHDQLPASIQLGQNRGREGAAGLDWPEPSRARQSVFPVAAHLAISCSLDEQRSPSRSGDVANPKSGLPSRIVRKNRRATVLFRWRHRWRSAPRTDDRSRALAAAVLESTVSTTKTRWPATIGPEIPSWSLTHAKLGSARPDRSARTCPAPERRHPALRRSVPVPARPWLRHGSGNAGPAGPGGGCPPWRAEWRGTQFVHTSFWAALFRHAWKTFRTALGGTLVGFDP